MIKEFIGTGKTIEEATASAKAGLNAPATADVKIEVVQMPEKKKFFGLFGGSDAKVKASFDDGKKEKKPAKKKAPAPAKSNDKKPEKKQTERKQPEKKQAEKKTAPAETSKPQHTADAITEKDVDLDGACAYLMAILEGLKVKDAKLSARVEDGVVVIDVDCEDYGIIIGRRGETLDAIQYLTGLAIKNVINKYVRVTINVGDYRAKREETLRALAVKNANYVVRSGRRFIFEPMNPYERKIIHTAVQEVEGAVSRSVGSGMDRKVLIEPEGGVKNYSRGSRGGSSRGGNGSRRSQYKPAPADPNREKKVDRADIPKFGKIEVNKD
ncbi:MAG: Jag N-terminal domain-containing protein [Eubacteriales bacterium]|nr:Jag N-terminal domain-containing protein [Eubacteriales bacterium]